jgi:outer membrane protein TolC
MRAVAQAEATTQRHAAMFRGVQLRRDIYRQALKLALVDRTVELGRDDLASLELLATTTEDKYRNGFATQVEVLTSQSERARRSNLLRTDENLVQAERASLERLLNRRTNSVWPRFLLPAAATNLPPVQLMVEHATTMAPQLDVMRGSLRQAELSVKLARKLRLPDVTIGLDGRQYADTGDFREGVVTLGISLPWGNRSRYSADIKREQLKAEAAQLEIMDMQIGLREEIVRIAAQIENARREALLYRDDIIPRTEQAVEAARVNWLNNRGALRDVLETRRMWIEARTMEARALADQHAMLAELSMHCGVEDLNQLAAKHAQSVEVLKGNEP